MDIQGDCVCDGKRLGIASQAIRRGWQAPVEYLLSPTSYIEKEPLVEWGMEDFEQCPKFASICLKDAGVFTDWKLFCCQAMAVQQ